MPFISKEELKQIYKRINSLEVTLEKIEGKVIRTDNELFVKNFFYDYPNNCVAKDLLKREAVVFKKVSNERTYSYSTIGGFSYRGAEEVREFYTDEKSYKKYESLIKMFEKEAKEFLSKR